MTNIRLEKVPCQILYATLATNERYDFCNIWLLVSSKDTYTDFNSFIAMKFGEEFKINNRS